MLIKIRHNSTELSDGTTKDIIPSLTLREFSNETDVLNNISGASQDFVRPDAQKDFEHIAAYKYKHYRISFIFFLAGIVSLAFVLMHYLRIGY